MPPFSAISTPAFSRPSLATFGARPVANITLSAIDAHSRSDKPNAKTSSPSRSIAATVQPVTTLMPCRSMFIAHMRAHVIVEAAQDVFAAIDQRHLRAEAGKDPGELHRDIAAALDERCAAAASAR